MLKNKYISISLDGAAGSGKSTTANSLCEKFKYIHVDTGLHYRAISLFFLNKNISPDLVSDYLLHNKIILASKFVGFSVLLQVDGEQFSTEQLRNDQMNKMVSYYARLPEVRKLLLSYQRSLPKYGENLGYSGIIMDGRDIGSVVLPDADLKFFLHADLQLRQSRRNSDGESDSITNRDRLDSTRKISPLKCPEGAISIDTGLLSINEVIEKISFHILSLS